MPDQGRHDHLAHRVVTWFQTSTRTMLKRIAAELTRAFSGPPPDSTAAGSYELRGLRVVVENTRPDIGTADVLERLDEALALIEQYAPSRFRHLQRDVGRSPWCASPVVGRTFPMIVS